MPMSEAARAAQGERMRQRHAAKRSEKMTDPALQEALAKAPFVTISKEATDRMTDWPRTGNIVEVHRAPSIVIEVDWAQMPMLEAQQFYAHLKDEFEKAGRILNARSMERVSGYTCFMCHKHFNGNPGFTDHSYIDPKTGLSPRVDCCGELCVINYHKMRIDQNLGARQRQAAEQRGE